MLPFTISNLELKWTNKILSDIYNAISVKHPSINDLVYNYIPYMTQLVAIIISEVT